MHNRCAGLARHARIYALSTQFRNAATPSTGRVRWNTTAAATSDAPKEVEAEGTLFVDSVFPVQLGIWDFRHLMARTYSTRIMGSLKETLDKIHTHDFQVESIEPRIKDGGAFVKFKYNKRTEEAKQEGEEPTERPSLEQEIKTQVKEAGGIRTWLGNANGEVWLVRGKPWKEDMRRYAANTIKVHFEGPDIYQETLYDLMRPYGQISDITNPVPVPAGNLRYSTIKFASSRAATRAHNCVHGFTLVDDPAIPGTTSGGKPTRLATVYERAIKGQAAREWMASHPRIVVPVLVFLLGTLSYIVFDPIRTVAVQAKVLNWLDFGDFKVIQWLRRNTLDRISFFRKAAPAPTSPVNSAEQEGLWKDRKEAEKALRSYLAEAPSTIAFVHGPQGSGKSSMLNRALKDGNRRTLVIDCEELNKARSDADVINGLASQTGYWPVFTWLNNFTNLIDLASVGLIGQKSGLSSSVETQLKELLEVVGNALKGVSTRHLEIEKTKELARNFTEQTEARARQTLEKIQQGTYHDGRIDVVSGSGVISELGIGDEKMTDKDKEGKKKAPEAVEKAVIKAQEKVIAGKNAVKETLDSKPKTETTPAEDTSSKTGLANVVGVVQGGIQDVVKSSKDAVKGGKEGAEKLWTDAKDQLGLSQQDDKPRPIPSYEEKEELDEEIRALPVVVIKNYATKTPFTDLLITVLADWAAGLADEGLAHVVVLSDNRDNGRRLEKALPAKPLAAIALADADPASALSFVQDKLSQYGVSSNLNQDQKVLVERLGGRSSDLEALCHKVKNGMPVEMAVDDIVARGVGELRKSAFGEDVEDSKSMAWSREQVYYIVKLLAKTNEVPYYDVLIDFPFKGDEAALRGLEHAEFISIITQDGRPSTIRPGKPVYRYVFERLVNDPVFRSVQDIALNEKAIASNESTIKTCEEELLKLQQIRPLDNGLLSIGATRQRADFLLTKLYEAEKKIESLEQKNAKLKKDLKRP